jgi:hypothetical protein
LLPPVHDPPPNHRPPQGPSNSYESSKSNKSSKSDKSSKKEKSSKKSKGKSSKNAVKKEVNKPDESSSHYGIGYKKEFYGIGYANEPVNTPTPSNRDNDNDIDGNTDQNFFFGIGLRRPERNNRITNPPQPILISRGIGAGD